MNPNKMNDANYRDIAYAINDGKVWWADDRYMLEFARRIHNAALEEAADLCRELVNDDNSDDYRNAADWCAIRIEGMKS